MPEGAFPLTEPALYLATCPKSNSSLAFFDAMRAVEQEQEADVPNHLKDANRDKEGFGHGRGYMYPHASQEHWVAQQYLPQALQGKMFYEPGEQGYEQQIAHQVARRREAQLAAMVETGDDWRLETGGETLTTGPKSRARDMWLQRVVDDTGRGLGALRDRMFELAQVQRHNLLLDLNAGSGLLTWEALRHAPEGGVWALTSDPQAGEALRQQAERLAELQRPTVLVGEPQELPYLLQLRGEGDVRFDRVLARNPLARFELDAAPLAAAAAVLREDGVFVFAQVVPRHGQRLHELVDWSAAPREFEERVVQAEEAIYQDQGDPLVRWDAEDLQEALNTAGFQKIELKREQLTEQRRITDRHLQRWFQELPLEDGRATYHAHLHQAGLSNDEIEEVAGLYARQLRDATVTWKSRVLFIVARIWE